jgi:hypothetical protein
MPASWASTILLCAGFAVLSFRQTKYIISDDIDLKGRSSGRRHLPRTDDAHADDDDLSSDHGGIIASGDGDGDDDRPGDDIHEYDALGGMADFIQPEDGTIRSISLLGERNSGTRWIYGRVDFFFSVLTSSAITTIMSPSIRLEKMISILTSPPLPSRCPSSCRFLPSSVPPPRVTFHYVCIYIAAARAFFR